MNSTHTHIMLDDEVKSLGRILAAYRRTSLSGLIEDLLVQEIDNSTQLTVKNIKKENR